MKLAKGKDIYNIVSVYVHQSGQVEAEKDNFLDELHLVVTEIPTSEILILLVDLNGHEGNSSAAYVGLHGVHVRARERQTVRDC